MNQLPLSSSSSSRQVFARLSKTMLLLFVFIAGQGLQKSQAQHLEKNTAAEKIFYVSSFTYDKKDYLSIADKQLPGYKAVVLRDSAKEGKVYISLDLHSFPSGTYELFSQASIAPAKTATKLTYWMLMQLGDGRPTKRILYDNYAKSSQYTGKFDLTENNKVLKIWLPADIALGYLKVKPYQVPSIPKALVSYIPKVVPPSEHPRLWVTPTFLPQLRKRLQSPEDTAAWNKVRMDALAPSHYDLPIEKEIFHNEKLEYTIQTKAFYYLITEDRKVGQEAVDLVSRYLDVLEFGNVTYGDITREIGRAIYTASLVYDWCYGLMDSKTKDHLRKHLMRLSRDMEIGWPPFVDPIVNGHANEAQVSRDLLAMSIAIYNEDTEPYKYTSYVLLEQLVPMREFEFQSPRHSQGVDYGAYRLGWEMYGAMFFYRMLGEKVYEDNLKNLPYYWLYMRLPDGYMLRDGDMFSNKNIGKETYYWKQPQTMLLCASYLKDSLIKGEFVRQGGLPNDPVLFLLANNPEIPTTLSPEKLPLTKDFGKVIGGMVTRTGWDNTAKSNNVVAEIKGGGYNFGNHQHPDAGALQIYFHGMQLGDIGMYLSYGSPYDLNFNKRSVAHSMMLAYDPNEKIYYRAKTKDGGARFSQRFPVDVNDVQNDPWFNYGSVLSSDFGPSIQKPIYSFFKADLTAAYSEKMKDYFRSFCFLNTEDKNVPGIIVLVDNMATSVSGVQQYWQINTLNAPKLEDSTIVLHNQFAGVTGQTYVSMLQPSFTQRNVSVLGGDSSRSVFGDYYSVNVDREETKAYRIILSPKKTTEKEKYLTVFQMVAANAKPLPVLHQVNDGYYEVWVGDFLNITSAEKQNLSQHISFRIPEKGKMTKVVVNGLASGFWNLVGKNGSVGRNVYVQPEKNSLYFELPSGDYQLNPGRDYNAGFYDVPTGKPYIFKDK